MNAWLDTIRQKRDIMIDIPLEKYLNCYEALKEIDSIYFIAGQLNDETVRMYIELPWRQRLALSSFQVTKVPRLYFLSLDYVKEIKSLKVIYEYGLFQAKLSRVPKKKEIINMKIEELAKLKPYLPTLVNYRTWELNLKKNRGELARVQKRMIEEDEGNRWFFIVMNEKANQFIKSHNEDNK